MINIKDIRIGDKLVDRYDNYYTYEITEVNNDVRESTAKYGYNYYYKTVRMKIINKNGRVVCNDTKYFTSETRLGEFTNNFLTAIINTGRD